MHFCDTAHNGRDAAGVTVSSPRAGQVPKAPVIVDGHMQVHAGGQQGGVAGHVADLGQCPPAGQGAGVRARTNWKIGGPTATDQRPLAETQTKPPDAECHKSEMPPKM